MPGKYVNKRATTTTIRVDNVSLDAAKYGGTYGRHCGCDGVALEAMCLGYGSLVFVC